MRALRQRRFHPPHAVYARELPQAQHAHTHTPSSRAVPARCQHPTCSPAARRTLQHRQRPRRRSPCRAGGDGGRAGGGWPPPAGGHVGVGIRLAPGQGDWWQGIAQPHLGRHVAAWGPQGCGLPSTQCPRHKELHWGVTTMRHEATACQHVRARAGRSGLHPSAVQANCYRRFRALRETTCNPPAIMPPPSRHPSTLPGLTCCTSCATSARSLSRRSADCVHVRGCGRCHAREGGRRGRGGMGAGRHGVRSATGT